MQSVPRHFRLRFPLIRTLTVAAVAGLLPAALPPLPPVLAQLRSPAPRSADPPLRVLLLESATLTLTALERPLRLQGAGGLVIPPGQTVRLDLQADGSVLLDDGRSRQALPPASAYWLQPISLRAVIGSVPGGSQAPAESPGAAAATGDDPAVEPRGDFQLQQRRYRGQLQVLVGGSALRAVNHLPLESYLPSVVGSEMPASWPQAALRAQAVAARTYALRQRRAESSFDLRATVASQVYRGIEAETVSTREAVLATRGQVLIFDGDLVNAVFHSSGGGTTENSGDIWSRQLPYLVSVPDFDASSPVSRWQQRLEPEQLRRAFQEIGGVQRIDVLASTASGRIRQARITGPRGTLVLTGPELRTRLGLRSSLVRFETVAPELAMGPVPALESPTPTLSPSPTQALSPSPFQSSLPPLPDLNLLPLQVPQPTLVAIGRGFGHGVGMSQWGAYAMALQGRSYQQILSHYYRGTELRSLPAP